MTTNQEQFALYISLEGTVYIGIVFLFSRPSWIWSLWIHC